MILSTLLLLVLLFGYDKVAAAIPLSESQASPTLSQNEPWQRVGVILVSQNGLDGDKPLRYAYQDGERLEKMLGTVGQIRKENLFLLKVDQMGNLRETLSKIALHIDRIKKQNQKVLLQFYYSGHGGANQFNFPDGKISFDAVKSALGGDRADARVYVLDVCFGASFFTAKGFRTAPPLKLELTVDKTAKGEVTISSSASDEQAYEVKNLGGSIFTNQWIMALRGAGDRNRDGQVTLFEAYNYAYDRTSGYSAETLNRPQHPSYQMDLTSARDVILAKVMQSSTGILFKNCPPGSYNLIDLKHGIQIGELRIPEGEDFTLALEPGIYRLQYQKNPSRVMFKDLVLTSAAMSVLSFDSFKMQTLEMGLSKGSFRSQSRSFWEYFGLEYSLGLGIFQDPTLEKNFKRYPELDEYFALQGAFDHSFLRTQSRMSLSWFKFSPWFISIHFGKTETNHVKNTIGQEPGKIPADTNQIGFPLTLNWKVEFKDLLLGVSLVRQYQISTQQKWAWDVSLDQVTRSIQEKGILTRSLYNKTSNWEDEEIAGGYRIETAGTWMFSVFKVGQSHSLDLGIRMAPYFCEISQDLPRTNLMNSNSREWGIAFSATFSLSSLEIHEEIEP